MTTELDTLQDVQAQLHDVTEQLEDDDLRDELHYAAALIERVEHHLDHTHEQ
jgi:hypothetical protein